MKFHQNTIYEYFFDSYISKNPQALIQLESAEIKNLDSESEIFRNNFINYMMSLYEQKNSKIISILNKIVSNFSSIKGNNDLLAIRSSSN